MKATRGLLHIVLVRPQIPHNTGSIGRLALNFGARLVRRSVFRKSLLAWLAIFASRRCVRLANNEQ
jgi:tRNA C32,U32 (ribose-2'-O)-methylase TrmJ